MRRKILLLHNIKSMYKFCYRQYYITCKFTIWEFLIDFIISVYTPPPLSLTHTYIFVFYALHLMAFSIYFLTATNVLIRKYVQLVSVVRNLIIITLPRVTNNNKLATRCELNVVTLRSFQVTISQEDGKRRKLTYQRKCNTYFSATENVGNKGNANEFDLSILYIYWLIKIHVPKGLRITDSIYCDRRLVS